MNEKSVRDRLIEHGQALYNSPRKLVQFTGQIKADTLLNDLTRYPHAYVLACIMDRQMKAERAWMIPYRILEKIGDFSIQKLSKLSMEDVNRLMGKPEPLHRFVDLMANYFYSVT